jgi:hypothetical protein
MSKKSSQETIVSNANFVLWSLHNISLGSSALVLLNKRTHQTYGQPHEIRTGLVLCVDLEPNLDLVSMFSTLFLYYIVCHMSKLPTYCSSLFNDYGLYHRVWVGRASMTRIIYSYIPVSLYTLQCILCLVWKTDLCKRFQCLVDWSSKISARAPCRCVCEMEAEKGC